MLETHVFEGKNEEEVMERCLGTLMVTKDQLYMREETKEGSLFKAKKYKIEVISKDEIKEFIKSFMSTIANQMKIEINCEVREQEDIFHVTLVSSHNAILIGKDGRTLNALQIIMRQALQKQTGFPIKVDLDASHYKAHKNKNFEYEIKKIAKEVLASHVDVKLDPMNSYQRRLVHNVVSKYDHLTSFSTGEGVDRFVTIAYHED